MKRKIVTTADGSATIFLPEWNEHYHSKHGAIQEALHVFIRMGFLHAIEKLPTKKISILEIGFGTGLNALITLLEAKKIGLEVDYAGVEAYPVSFEELHTLNYAESFTEEDSKLIFDMLHRSAWGVYEEITSRFHLLKEQKYFSEINDVDNFNLIYFDAFGPRVQPELWTEEIFAKMYLALKEKGCLVTYSAKGSVRRSLQAVGFQVERLPGPPGKREMLRASKNL